MKLDNNSLDYNNSKEFEKKINNGTKYRVLIIALLLIVTLAPISYAFFTVDINENESVQESVVQAGTMSIIFTDGSVIGTTTNWVPGDYITKTFTVENTGSLPAAYSVYLEDIINTFVDKTELVYEIESTTDGVSSAYSTSSAQQVPDSNTKIINNQTINSLETHTYVITLRFMNLDKEQNYNQGKIFEGKIQVYDVNNEPTNHNVNVPE